ncbi:hypothetical protein [Mesorhizobium sp. M0018]|uniref:hypothetical protein n=1 Tax=Mesorhizobium sp. M0018 TaxID=2956844 RepID=UPI00333C210C
MNDLNPTMQRPHSVTQYIIVQVFGNVADFIFKLHFFHTDTSGASSHRPGAFPWTANWVTGAGRKNCHVAGLQGQCTAPVAPNRTLPVPRATPSTSFLREW